MIARVAIDLALDRLFTYKVPEALQEKLTVGQLLSVPFGHRSAQGFVIEIGDDEKTTFKLKAINSIVDETPFFTNELIELIRRISAYTAAPLESVIKAALPAAVLKRNMRARELLFVAPALTPNKDIKVTKNQQWLYTQVIRLGGGWLGQLCKELKTTPSSFKALSQKGLVTLEVKAHRRDPLAGRKILPSKPLALNQEQTAALATINEANKPVLLFGVTGSGKTEVYLQAIAKVLGEGKGAIVMVPEIALTPQTVQRFASRFGNKVAVLHSALSDGERYDEWHRIRSGEARVVVGPRSAVFAPVKKLGLIVVDEEHESSYKQEDNPRYHARDVAVLRGIIEGARVVLGSATPSFESWNNVQLKKYVLAKMSQRAGAGTLPNVYLVAMSKGIFSHELIDAIKLRLNRGEQTILFLNRRGYSRSVRCESCGEVITCPECDMPYTYHRADECLRCHICGGWIPVPTACPNCKAVDFDFHGFGTQKAEAALKKCFPRATILRMDADSVSRKNSHDDILSAFRRGEADILLGTQMIAKGLDFPNVTLVGVLNADSSLNMPDFRASERTYQLVSQVAGRAGRAELPGEVFIQTYDTDSAVLQSAAKGGYEVFAARELSDRKAAELPPYTHLALISFKSKDLKQVGGWAELYAKALKKHPPLLVSDPMPSVIEKADGWYRWQVTVRAKKVSEIVNAWRWLTEKCPPSADLRLAIDIDAFSLI